jgi:putative ABC transport system permease protein
LKAPTLVAAFAAGTVLTLAVIFLTARRTSRMTIVAAIRDLPEPPTEKKRHPRIRGVALAIFGALGLVALVQPVVSRLAGGIVLILVLASLARPRLSQRSHATLTGLALAGWSIAVLGAADPGADPRAVSPLEYHSNSGPTSSASSAM